MTELADIDAERKAWIESKIAEIMGIMLAYGCVLIDEGGNIHNPVGVVFKNSC